VQVVRAHCMYVPEKEERPLLLVGYLTGDQSQITLSGLLLVFGTRRMCAQYHTIFCLLLLPRLV
jgi:hypothetical protein